MLRNHWKKILLSLCALFWGGCGDDSSSSEEKTACSLEEMCPEYGILYNCENEEDKIAGNFENCTMSYPSCSNRYSCEDGIYCWESNKDNITSYDCYNTQDSSFELTQDEFETKYYTKEQRY